MALVAGVDSSTQSVKVTIRDAQTGEQVRSGRAVHPDGTAVPVDTWWRALQDAIADAGGLADVQAMSVAAQQHGMVALDSAGEPVHDALLWNDTRSASDAADLVAERGASWWADQTGSVPVASFTVTKLRWLARNHPDLAGRVADVMLPHDWLTWRLLGSPAAGATTDRGDASGTGYFSPTRDEYLSEVMASALGHEVRLPRVLAPSEPAGQMSHVLLGPGTGDNMAAALGVGAEPGDVVVSIGTSGTVFATGEVSTHDPSGIIAGFADAAGGFLPLVCTLNASRVLDAACQVLGVDHPALDDLALSAPAGAGGLVLLPYLEGERTPNLPGATGSLHGINRANSTASHYARAAVEGMLCGLAAGLEALRAAGVPCRRVLLVGGGARSKAVASIAPTVFGVPVVVPEPDEYVAAGAARQAAWTLTGELPTWQAAGTAVYEGELAPAVMEQYSQVRRAMFGV